MSLKSSTFTGKAFACMVDFLRREEGSQQQVDPAGAVLFWQTKSRVQPVGPGEHSIWPTIAAFPEEAKKWMADGYVKTEADCQTQCKRLRRVSLE